MSLEQKVITRFMECVMSKVMSKYKDLLSRLKNKFTGIGLMALALCCILVIVVFLKSLVLLISHYAIVVDICIVMNLLFTIIIFYIMTVFEKSITTNSSFFSTLLLIFILSSVTVIIMPVVILVLRQGADLDDWVIRGVSYLVAGSGNIVHLISGSLGFTSAFIFAAIILKTLPVLQKLLQDFLLTE